MDAPTPKPVPSTLARLFGSIYDNRGRIAVLLIGLFLTSLYFIGTSLKVDNSLKVWFDDGDASYRTFMDFQEQYGNDDIITLMVSYPHSVLRPAAIAEMLELESQFAALPYVSEVYTFGSSDFIAIEGSGVTTSRMIETVPQNEAEVQALAERLQTLPLIRETLISKDEKSHLILLRLDAFEEIERDRDIIVREIRAIADETLPNYQMAGLAVVYEALNTTISEESGLFSLLNYLVIMVLLILIIPKRRYIFIVLAAIIFSLVLTFGLFAATGYSLNMISITLPTILMVYALADAVHVINNYVNEAGRNMGETKRATLVAAMVYSAKPCFYSSITTMLAYIAFYASPLEVLKITGLFAFIGLGIAFISVYLISIIGLALLKKPEDEKGWSIVLKINRLVGKFADWITQATSRHKALVAAVSVVTFSAGITLLQRVEVDTYPGEYLDPSSTVRQDGAIIEEKMGAYLPFEFVVRSAKGDSIMTSEALTFLDELEAQMAQSGDIYTPSSIVGVIKYLNQQLSPSKEYGIPEQSLFISQILSAYEAYEGNRLLELTNEGRTEARITGRIRMMSANQFKSVINEVEAIFDELGGPEQDLELHAMGYMPLYIEMTRHITSSLLYSFLGAFVMVSIALMVFIRKVRLTILSVLVNLVPLAFISIVLVVFEIPLDMGTVMIAAILLGIAVDDTVHLVHVYMKNQKGGEDPVEAIDKGLKSTMLALLATSLALTLGFLTLGMSSVSSLQNFGNLCAAAVAVTFVVDVLLYPVVIKVFKPRG